MTRTASSRALAIAAGAVIIALTAAAFWLSYAHLAEVAAAHGLQNSPVRAWAWPATLDLFIVAGELLMLRAALAKQVDPWAIGLTTVGSLGSIVLNVAGVTGTRDPGAVPLLDYVVAAVPPTAALLAFGALMRQVHQALAGAAVGDTPAPVAVTVIERAEVSPDTPGEVSAPLVATPVPAIAAPPVKPLVICGDRMVWDLGVTPVDTGDEVSGDAEGRLPSAAARVVIESCWAKGTPATETARMATRSVSYVKKVFGRLDDDQGPQQVPGQLSLMAGEVSA